MSNGFVLKDAFVSIDANDLSAYVESVELPVEVEQQENTSMGDNTRIHLAGLKNFSITVNFRQDFDASAVDAILWPIFDAGNAVTVKVRPTSSAAGSANPEYSASCILATYNILGQSVGELAGASAEFQPAGDLSRATA